MNEEGDPLSRALSEMLKGQLDLTTSFLESQKRLYATYCASLNAIVSSDHHAPPAAVKRRNEVSPF